MLRESIDARNGFHFSPKRVGSPNRLHVLPMPQRQAHLSIGHQHWECELNAVVVDELDAPWDGWCCFAYTQ